MESIPISTYSQQQTDIHHQQQQQQPTTSQLNLPQSTPTTTTAPVANPTTARDSSSCKSIESQQNIYQVKCSLLEYHIQEALLINKAIKSELKQYKDKIEFEKRLRKFLVDRVGSIDS